MDVTLQYFKWNRQRHWRHELQCLGSDDRGTWMAASVGAELQKGDSAVESSPVRFVQLVPHSGDWIAMFKPAGGEHQVYVDITSSPLWRGDSLVEAVDLDLDVVRYWTGEIDVLDHDEFELNQRLFAYPPDVVDNAESTAEVVLSALRSSPNLICANVIGWFGVLDWVYDPTWHELDTPPDR